MMRETPGKGNSIGYACSYVPAEIILAGGMMPWRILPGGVSADTDAFIHPATCPQVKGILSEAMRGGYRHLDGIILANSCDGMRRLADILPAHAERIPVLFIDIPKKKTPDAISLFAATLRRMIGDMEEKCHAVPVTTAALHDAIRRCNEVRRLMNDIFTRREQSDEGAGGGALLELCREAGRTDPDAFSQKLKDLIQKVNKNSSLAVMPRVAVTGNAFHQPAVVQEIERSGAKVAALDSCIGERHFGTMVDENAPDPVMALAERYLLKAPCARMNGMDERIEYIQTLIRESRADGLIAMAPKYCDTLLYELPVLKDRAGIPFLALDYDPDGLNAQAATRIEAFVEMLKGGK